MENQNIKIKGRGASRQTAAPTVVQANGFYLNSASRARSNLQPRLRNFTPTLLNIRVKLKFLMRRIQHVDRKDLLRHFNWIRTKWQVMYHIRTGQLYRFDLGSGNQLFQMDDLELRQRIYNSCKELQDLISDMGRES